MGDARMLFSSPAVVNVCPGLLLDQDQRGMNVFGALRTSLDESKKRFRPKLKWSRNAI